MKKVLFILLACISSISIYAQDKEDDLVLSMEQIAKIKQINKETYPKFEVIGRNISLSGYERVRQRRVLLLEQKREIMNVLSAEQRKLWEEKFKDMPPATDIRESIRKEYDARIKEWDAQYSGEKKALENDSSLDKANKKARLKGLQESYKAERERLKGEKDALRDSFY